MSQDLSQTFTLGSLTLQITEGDITRADAEAITNAANNRLYMGAGVAGAIKRAGGPAVEREAVAKGPIPIGSAVETTAGDLPYKYVIHGAVMGTDLRTDADLIARTTLACLELADKLRLGSLALPAFGTGVGGFPMEEAGRIMTTTLARFAEAGPSHLQRVVVVLWGESAYNAFLCGARAALEDKS